MFTSLHTMARLAVLAFAGLSLIALTAAQLHPRTSLSLTRDNHWEALGGEIGDDRGVIRLIDRASGEMKVVDMPPSERWDFLGTSPMMAEDDSMEAVGRYASPINEDATSADGTVGIVRVRLPEGEVLERLEMDVMPTGRPAWDPLGASHVIFPGATGRLYSYRFSREGSSEASSISPLQWRCEPPGGREPFVIDPVWPRDPQLHNLLIVSLSRAKRLGDTSPDQPLAPWWLELDEDCEAIVDAGPLFDPKEPLMNTPRVRMRYPNVAQRDGRLELIYLRHDSGDAVGSLCSAELEIVEGTNRPRVRKGTAGRASEHPVVFGSMLPTLDARLAFTFPALGDHPIMVSLERPTTDATTQ